MTFKLISYDRVFQQDVNTRKNFSRQGNLCRDTDKRSLYRDKVMYVMTLKKEENLVVTDKQGRDM